MANIAIYTFNSGTDTLPTFNEGYTYTYTDVDNGDGTITRTIVGDSSPTSISFKDCTALIRVEYLDKTENITSMAYMFSKCTNLISINTSNFKTDKVTDMTYMFEDCKSLLTLDLSSFDTSKVTTMSNMFKYCSNLTSVNLSNFITSDVTDMNNMFTYCKKNRID